MEDLAAIVAGFFFYGWLPWSFCYCVGTLIAYLKKKIEDYWRTRK